MLSAIGGQQAVKANVRKDKLSLEKEAAARAKEARKNELSQKKLDKKEAERANGTAFREVRQLSGADSKRAGRDARAQARKEANRESGEKCEHGIWKCRICNPVVKRK